ncbi:30S ribosomal protein S18 [Candidatus Vidania fulgoroideorum]
MKNINFKNLNLLKKFMNNFFKIKPRKKNIKVKIQKKISKAIKVCRFLSLFPYINE